MVSISVVIKVIFHVLLSQRNGGQNKFLIFHNFNTFFLKSTKLWYFSVLEYCCLYLCTTNFSESFKLWGISYKLFRYSNYDEKLKNIIYIVSKFPLKQRHNYLETTFLYFHFLNRDKSNWQGKVSVARINFSYFKYLLNIPTRGWQY